ncbi:MAG: hypothetical protein H0U66_01965 [Gemmatimonadaceae bacterium]|nr:hypothetical protein [Gemmatimonadaceae bacterium]
MTERESIASYFEHLAECEFGSLIDAFTPRQVMAFAAAWVQNRVDEKHHAEVAANTPRKEVLP